MKQRAGAAFLAVLMMLSMIPAARGTGTDDVLVLVGLAYGKTALDGANLENSVGKGYRLGYLNEAREFQSLGYTDVTGISVVKTQNVWYGIDSAYSNKLKCYSDAVTSDIGVGCWHIQLPTEEVYDFESAFAKAQEWGGFPAWIDGEWQIRLGAYFTQEEAQADAEAVGGTVVGTSVYGTSVVKTGTATILFQFDGGEDISLAVAPGLEEGEKAVTHFRGERYYGIFQFSRVRGGDLVVSNLLSLGDYTNSVISHEMSPTWPIEALKAQAVSARSYYEDNLGKHSAYGFDICSTTDCQVYFGMNDANAQTSQAVRETEGLRAWYQGKPAKTYYFSSDGGGTEACKNVWTESLPYLCGVIDPYEATVENKIAGYHWTVQYTPAELTERLHKLGYGIGTSVTDFQISELTPTGNVQSITFTYENGKTQSFYKDTTRTLLSGVMSRRYTVTKSGGESERIFYTDGGGTISTMNQAYAINGQGSIGKVSGTPYAISASGTQILTGESKEHTGDIIFTISGTGWGHHVGMSQWGAYAMAQQGFTYEEILKFYYPGIEIY